MVKAAYNGSDAGAEHNAQFQTEYDGLDHQRGFESHCLGN